MPLWLWRINEQIRMTSVIELAPRSEWRNGDFWWNGNFLNQADHTEVKHTMNFEMLLIRCLRSKTSRTCKNSTQPKHVDHTIIENTSWAKKGIHWTSLLWFTASSCMYTANVRTKRDRKENWASRAKFEAADLTLKQLFARRSALHCSLVNWLGFQLRWTPIMERGWQFDEALWFLCCLSELVYCLLRPRTFE